MGRQEAIRSTRRWLAKKMKVAQIPDALWDELVAEGFVTTLEPTDRTVLARVAKERLELLYRGLSGTPTAQQPYPLTPEGDAALATYSPYERERTLAQSEYVAQKVSRLPAIRRFRAEILGGRVLSPEDAYGFVTSPLTPLLTVATFRSWGIPIVGHRATLVKEESDGETRHQTFHVAPPGVTLPPLADPIGRRTSGGELIVLHSAAHVFSLSNIQPESPLDELRLVCRAILPFTPWQAPAGSTETDKMRWPLATACARFILTGEAPLLLPVVSDVVHRAQRQISHTLIRLTIDPWMPAETVMQQYRMAQREVLGGDNRPLSLRNLAVFRFVTARTNDRGERPAWADLMAAWNATHPDETYREARLFSRDYRRIEQAVTAPPFAWHEAERIPADETAREPR